MENVFWVYKNSVTAFEKGWITYPKAILEITLKVSKRVLFSLLKVFLIAKFIWIKEENEDENDRVKFVTPSSLPRSNFRPAVSRVYLNIIHLFQEDII